MSPNDLPPPSPPSIPLSLLGRPSGANLPPAPIAVMWRGLRTQASLISVFWGVGVGISALPVPVRHPLEVVGAEPVSQSLQPETSVATDDVSYDAGPRLTPVTFLSKGTQ